MNHFVFNTLSALSYHISRESFLVAKRWYVTGLFLDVVAIFSLPSFKELSEENKKKIYDKINGLREENIDLIEKKKWLQVCREQLENSFEENKPFVRIKCQKKRKE